MSYKLSIEECKQYDYTQGGTWTIEKLKNWHETQQELKSQDPNYMTMEDTEDMVGWNLGSYRNYLKSLKTPGFFNNLFN